MSLARAAAGLLLLSCLLSAPVAAAAGGAGDDQAHAFNVYHGLIGEKDGVEPSLLWRAPGTPPPLLAMLINTGILGYLLLRFGARPVRDALKKRKLTIMQGMDDAARMKQEATARLRELEEKLEHIDDEVARVRREMKDAGEAERVRVLAEAKERRVRVERDARLVIEQELKAAHEKLLFETARAAVEGARRTLQESLTAEDHRRLAEEYVKSFDGALRQVQAGRS